MRRNRIHPRAPSLLYSDVCNAMQFLCKPSQQRLQYPSPASARYTFSVYFFLIHCPSGVPLVFIPKKHFDFPSPSLFHTAATYAQRITSYITLTGCVERTQIPAIWQISSLSAIFRTAYIKLSTLSISRW